MTGPYTDIPEGPVTLTRDRLSGQGYDWPGTNALAVWEASAFPGRWFAADRRTGSDGTTYPTAEAAAEAVGASLPNNGELSSPGGLTPEETPAILNTTNGNH